MSPIKSYFLKTIVMEMISLNPDEKWKAEDELFYFQRVLEKLKLTLKTRKLNWFFDSSCNVFPNKISKTKTDVMVDFLDQALSTMVETDYFSWRTYFSPDLKWILSYMICYVWLKFILENIKCFILLRNTMKSDILSLLSHEIRILLVQYLSPRKMLELFLPLAIISSKDCTFKISYLLLNDIRQFPVCTFPPEISKIKMNVSQTSSESRFF